MYDYQLEYVCSFQVSLDSKPHVIGMVAGEVRANFYSISGEVTGPRLQGRILPGGVDYLTIRSDGVVVLDVHLTIETHDGALIQVDYSGIADIGEDGQGLFLRNEVPTTVSARAVPRMCTGDPTYRWVNRCQFVSIGAASFEKMEISYDIYALR